MLRGPRNGCLIWFWRAKQGVMSWVWGQQSVEVCRSSGTGQSKLRWPACQHEQL